jgi:hypothetical protein
MGGTRAGSRTGRHFFGDKMPTTNRSRSVLSALAIEFREKELGDRRLPYRNFSPGVAIDWIAFRPREKRR